MLIYFSVWSNIFPRSVAKIHLGQLECFELGNLDSMRDWGHARDYVEGMWLMLQQDTPDDFVLATGIMHSVRSAHTLLATFMLTWHLNPQPSVPLKPEVTLTEPANLTEILSWDPHVSSIIFPSFHFISFPFLLPIPLTCLGFIQVSRYFSYNQNECSMFHVKNGYCPLLLRADWCHYSELWSTTHSFEFEWIQLWSM